MNELPKKIIIEDQFGDGFYIAEYRETEENANGENIPIYKVKEYYHELHSAIEDY